MTAINLTMQQRLNLEALIRQKRGEDNDDMRTLESLFKKIRIPKEERQQYIREIPGGTALIDQSAIDRAPELPIELEDAEVRKLKTTLREYKSWSVDDFEWKDPLEQQLIGR